MIHTSEKMMENEMVNWYAVELFLTICDAGGITAAARSGMARISQPALSAQMNALEQSIGQVLFERKPFRLTAEGILFRAEFTVLRKRMHDSLEKIKSRQQDTLRIAASDVVISQHLPRLLALMKLPSKVRLYLTDAPSHQLSAMVRDGEVDVAIGVMPSHADKGRLPFAELLMKVPVGIIAPPGKKLVMTAWRDLQQRLLQTEKPGLISLPAQNLISEHLMTSLRKIGISWPITMEVSSLSHVATFVSLGLGYGVSLPHVREGAMKKLPWLALPPTIVPPLTIGMWYGEHPSALAKVLIQAARNYSRSIIQSAEDFV